MNKKIVHTFVKKITSEKRNEETFHFAADFLSRLIRANLIEAQGEKKEKLGRTGLKTLKI